MKTLAQALNLTARLWLPRLLTQACRDPLSPLWGSFDRDWWHYRIRDFSSLILQQGGYAVYLASERAENAGQRAALRQLAGAAAFFWNQRALRRGAFEEYYPWEQGYPPLAFSTLAVMKLAAAGVVPPARVRAGAAVAARQLQARFEARAANQQVAGLAGLAWGRKIFPELVSDARFETLIQQSLALQTPEGWFQEYGGPDLGYLSVTVDCLWDLYDATGDQRFTTAIDRAAACLRQFLQLLPSGSLGMHNSRNTDYLVPYGLVRLALQQPTPENVSLVSRLFSGTASPGHFFNAVDDRYVSHYIGQSVFRAVLLLEQAAELAVKQAAEQTVERAAELPVAAVSAVTASHPFAHLTASGHFLRQTASGQSLVVTLRKGGIFSQHMAGGSVHDFGWVLEAAGRQHISHWWSDDWKYGETDDGLWVEGALYEHRELANTPARHMALRLASLVAGHRLIGLLKKKLIFKKRPSPIHLRRTLIWKSDGVRVVDVFSQVPAGVEFLPAPRSSKRHVASADSFQQEDFQPLLGGQLVREFKAFAQGMEIVTDYTVGAYPPAA